MTTVAHLPQEIEVKFHVLNLALLAEKLKCLGAREVQPRTFELNLRFDTPGSALASSGQVLRLRRDSASRLTYKGAGQVSQGVSARTEIEFTVGDFDAAHDFLVALGFHVSMIYEKYRQVFALGATLVTLDEMPFGYFVEIEAGDAAQIQQASRELGLDWEARCLDSYAAIFQQARAALALSFRDLTFENFAAIPNAAQSLGLLFADR